jgi:3,4-dihydroxy 2-butanone 4-phosphate synthase / GTP cyclohydrolase II
MTRCSTKSGTLASAANNAGPPSAVDAVVEFIPKGGAAPISDIALHEYLSPTSAIIDEARAGRMCILIDDEDRENEGDLIIPAEFADAEAVNFMARHGRGLIFLAKTRDRVKQLGLAPMSRSNGTRHETAFTVSIEARTGVTTGISAAGRAHTVATAIDPASKPHDVVTPGHVFPIMARDGGTLLRAGHTEASVDISRLAGLNAAGLICEIMNEDGTMARLPELVAFARRHRLKIGTIADLISYRRRTERLVDRRAETTITHHVGGEWKLIVYSTAIEYVERLVLVNGDLTKPGTIPVRMHSVDLAGDILGLGQSTLHGAMRMIAERGRGAVVILRDVRPEVLSDKARGLQGVDPAHTDLWDYRIGARILIDLGIRDMILLSNTHSTIKGHEGYGLNVVGQLPITAGAESSRS